MYSRMTEAYELLFPTGAVKLRFVLDHLPATPARVLDVGCATGELARELAARGHTVTGLDPEPTMVDRARKLARKACVEVSFVTGGFESVRPAAAGNRFDAVCCMGNTMPHAKDEETVRTFLNDCRAVLVPRGRLLLQLVNMDRAEALIRSGFPERTAGSVRLSRRYLPHDTPDRVWFETRISDEESGESVTGRVPLLRLTKAMLARHLAVAGFEAVNWYGDFNGIDWTADAPATIVVATAPGR